VQGPEEKRGLAGRTAGFLSVLTCFLAREPFFAGA
jgi:hypothetical protein